MFQQTIPVVLVAFLFACTGNGPSSNGFASGEYEKIALMPIDDNFEQDTLLLHNTYEMNPGQFMMVARNVEENFEGLRMFLYKIKNGAANITATSTGAYDSWIYLPTFFISPDESDTLIMVETGERESWGARLVRLQNGQFEDLGFVDMAARGTKYDELEEQEVMVLKSIVPFTRISGNSDGLVLDFDVDVHLFDDHKGGLDTLYQKGQVRYLFSDSLRLAFESKNAS